MVTAGLFFEFNFFAQPRQIICRFRIFMKIFRFQNHFNSNKKWEQGYRILKLKQDFQLKNFLEQDQRASKNIMSRLQIKIYLNY